MIIAILFTLSRQDDKTIYDLFAPIRMSSPGEVGY
jgi:hypothetical protein